jgi:hypothetical protein
VSDFGAGSWSRWASVTEPQPSQAARLRRMTVHVPADYAEDLRRFARELCARYRTEAAQTAVKWQALSPSAELMVSPERSARCAVRDTRAPGVDRFRWSVAVMGQLNPVAEGRAESRAEARALAEAAVAAYSAEPSDGGSAGDD